MKAINESILLSRLDSGSTKRLRDYQKRLAADRDKRIFDDKALALLMKYAYYPKEIESVLHYLANLKDDEGKLFCRSRGQYEDLKVQFANFLKPEKPSFRWNRFYQSAVAKVTARYSQAGLDMLNYSCDEDIYHAVTDWSTATGWESIVSGRNKKKDVLRNVFLVHKEKEENAKKNGSFNVPVICGVRTQGSGAFDEHGKFTYIWKCKERAVFMIDVFTIISESRFGCPINEWLKSYPYSAIGKDDKWISRWVSYERNNGKGFISLDYSKYDSTIPSWLIRSAFDVIRSMFRTYDDELLTVIEEDFINKNIITAEGIIHATHGNPSGSRFTAIINGICNEIMTEAWLGKFNLRGNYNIMGDDNLIYIEGEMPDTLPSLVGQYIEHNFGIKVNADKSNSGSFKDDPEYLSRYWNSVGPWRYSGDVIAHLAYPERFRNYKDSKIKIKPEMVLFSYILSYRATMYELMDVDRFLRDCDLQFYSIEWTKEQREVLPYNMRLYLEVNNYKSKPPMSEILEGD